MTEEDATTERSTAERSEDRSAPAGWAAEQDALAADAVLALLLVAGHQPPALVVSNNNSFCRAFQSSPNHAHLCEPYCGKAFYRAMEAGEATYYRCHAGLHCFAMPVRQAQGRELAVIGGRAFLKSSDYRALAERFRDGDLSDMLSADLFQNVIFAAQQDLEELAGRVAAAAPAYMKRAAEQEEAGKRDSVAETVTGEARARTSQEVARELPAAAGRHEASPAAAEMTRSATEQREGLPSREQIIPQRMKLPEACDHAVRALIRVVGLNSVALLLRIDNTFVPMCVTGQFVTTLPRLTLDAKGTELIHAPASDEHPAGKKSRKPFNDVSEIFPLLVNGEIKGALLVGDWPLSAEKKQAITDYSRELALPLEVLRLREELERRGRAAANLRSFIERLNTLDPEEAYATILRHSAELLHAERGSLLLFDEASNELAVKAAIGPRAQAASAARMGLGEGVAGAVLSDGRPLVVRDVAAAGRAPAPAERSYKTGSFISYPIMFGGRWVGVLNVTDKIGGGSYDELDLNLLDMIAPQMALALDRAEWRQKATEFQLLSITDPLTGLLNRRYLEERMTEELERSKRYRYQMSFMMLDIDDFKFYNDQNGHQAGDLGLEMTAQCLKSALRAADTAARYGGEEFSILLPQTGLAEARVIAERIRRRVKRTRYPHGKNQPLGALTVSIGISAFSPALDTPAAVIGAADRALYLAKKRGKNRIETFPSEIEEAASPADHAASDAT